MTNLRPGQWGKTLGLINARGGSKGVPRKNIRPLGDAPLITYTIEGALRSKLTDVIVSTDDSEIAGISQEAGADVPFLRPSSLASDSASQLDVISHALDTLRAMGRTYSVVVLLQPVCPFRTSQDIDTALSMMTDERVGSVISVSNAESFHPMTMYISQNNQLKPLIRENHFGQRRQDFPKVWWRNGLIYAFRPDDFFEMQTLQIQPILPLEIPLERATNIDTELDWKLAEIQIKVVSTDSSVQEHH